MNILNRKESMSEITELIQMTLVKVKICFYNHGHGES